MFVSMCRLSGVTARTGCRVEGHNYPEFYLGDKSGNGHWIPAQVVGPPWFGQCRNTGQSSRKANGFSIRSRSNTFATFHTPYEPTAPRPNRS